MLLENKNAVIYGAGRDVGSAVARAFGRSGASVFLVGRRREPLLAVAQEIRQGGGMAEVAQADALSRQAVEQHLDEVVRKAGSIDIALNVIGIGYVQGAPLLEMNPEQFTGGITDAMHTQFLTMTAAGRQMSRQGS